MPVVAQDGGPTPRLRITPDCVAPWDGDDVGGNMDLRVRGNGFQPGSTVGLRFAEDRSGVDTDVLGPGSILRLEPSVIRGLARATQEDPALAVVNVDDLGAFDTTITPFWPMSEGRYLVTAVTRGGGPTGTAVLLVPCPTRIVVSTDCSASSGGAAPTAATISGSGFLPGSPVFARLLGGDLERDLGGSDAASDGTFLHEVPDLGGLPDGTYQVLAEQPRAQRRAIGFLETPCPSPRIELRPDCGPPGTSPARMELTVTGSGFRGGSPAFVIWDPQGSHEAWPVEVDEGGGFSVTIRPLARPDGRYGVRVENVPPRAPPRTATAAFTVPCEIVLPEVSISVDPACGRPELTGAEPARYQLTIRGAGFQPGLLTIVFDAQPVVAQESFEAEADGSGVVEVVIEPALRPSGSYLILATQPFVSRRAASVPEADLLLEASATFSVPCRGRTPSAPELDPECGPAAPGQEDAYRIGVSGSGFYPGGLVLVAFGRGRDAPTFAASTEADGTFATVIIVAGRGPGSYPVRVVQEDSGGTVLARSRAAFTVPCASDPRIAIRPDSGPAGYTALVEGFDFPPGASVTLTWDRGIDAGRPFEITAGADGRFAVYLHVLPNDFPGERMLRAGRPGEPDAYPSATDRYVVVAGTAMPPADEGYVFRR